MKTTIDIPEDLYKKAKIRAIERGVTLKQIVLTSLSKELEETSRVAEAPVSYWANRQLLPEYEAENPHLCGFAAEKQIPISKRIGGRVWHVSQRIFMVKPAG
ncbi:MAG: hypothetical protein O3A87_02520 [Verrucomicrobia bacterium]|nr:hypothetical protein [Verrucomicrobiota bacterium]